MSEKEKKKPCGNSSFKLKKSLLTSLAALLLLALISSAAKGNLDFESMENLPPGERYRQFSLLLLVSGGIEPGLLYLLEPIEQSSGAPGSAAGDNALGLDEYETPLARIVDQESMLADAARMFRFAQDNGPQIQAQLKEIAAANPILISMVDVNEIAEDAIIIRHSIADSIEYSDVIDHPEANASVQAYRTQTIYLRNMMEYNIFQEELAQITNEAIIDLGGRLDAYQRMFDDDVDPELVSRRIDSAEIMNAQTGENFDEQARMRTSELLMMLILMESQVR
jgi:hypothetical protein